MPRALDAQYDVLARPGVTRQQQVEAFRYVASSQVALGQEAEARRALRRLLTLSPAYRFPAGTAPKILALLEEQDRHGYDIGRLIDERSDGTITFHIASLYPTLYRMEAKGLIDGRWVERTGHRRRRYYRLTTAGRFWGPTLTRWLAETISSRQPLPAAA